MKTFKQFIAEAAIADWDLDVVDDAMLHRLLTQHCHDGLKAISAGGVLWRGFTSAPTNGEDGAVVDSSRAVRTSRDSDNLYQLMMDASKPMSGYPSRTNSFICSTSPSGAASYGKVYAMIPFDGTDVAVLSEGDIFRQHVKSPITNSDVDSFAQIGGMLAICGAPATGEESDKGYQHVGSASEYNAALAKFTPEELIVIWSMRSRPMERIEYSSFEFEQFAESLPRPHTQAGKQLSLRPSELAMIKAEAAHVLSHGLQTESKMTAAAYALFKKHTTDRFTAIASTVMTPATLQSSLVRYGAPLDYSREAWFSGKAVCIPATKFLGMISQLQEAGFPVHSSIFI